MRKLASPPYNIDVFAFDQRGHGRTSLECLTADSPEVKQWQAEGKKVKLEVNAKRLTGGWGKQMPDIEFWVKYRSQLAQSKGKKLFLWGFSMVSLSPPGPRILADGV
jgi:alpha-beta hydrolase superfamily lysophospholipase